MDAAGMTVLLLLVRATATQHLPIISDVSVTPRTGFIDPFGVATTTFHFEAVYKDADGDRFRVFELVAQTRGREYSWSAQNATGDPRRGVGAVWSLPLPRAGTYTISFRATDKDGAATAPDPITVRVHPWFYWTLGFALGFWILASLAASGFTKVGLTEITAAFFAWLIVAEIVPWAFVVWLLNAWSSVIRYYVAAVIVGATVLLGVFTWFVQRLSLRPQQA